jgi:TonB family protein
MKLPFSYKHHSFIPVFILSLISHAALMTGTEFFSLSPHYAVQQAPSSVEVVILKEKPQETADLQTKQVITTDDSSAKNTAFQEKKRKQQNPKFPDRTIVSTAHKGVLEETNSEYLKNPAPVYPRMAREQGWEGLVILNVWVGIDGKTSKISIKQSSGYKILDEAALKTVKKWIFQPAGIGKLSFRSQVKVPIRFVLVDE